MKNSPLNSILLGVLTVSALASVYFLVQYMGDSRQQWLIQSNLKKIAQNRELVGEMVRDAANYSQKNPAILPVLQRVGINVRTNSQAGAPSRPAAR